MKKKIITGLVLGLLLSSVPCLFGMEGKDKNVDKWEKAHKVWEEKGLKKEYIKFYRLLNGPIWIRHSKFKDFLKKPEVKQFVESFVPVYVAIENKYIMSKPLNALLFIALQRYTPVKGGMPFEEEGFLADCLTLVEFLIDNGVDVNYKDFKDKTPIEYAVDLMGAVISEQFWMRFVGLFSDDKIKIKKNEALSIAVSILEKLISKKPKISSKVRSQFNSNLSKLKKYLEGEKKELEEKSEELKRSMKDKKKSELKKKRIEKINDRIAEIKVILDKLKKINNFFNPERIQAKKDFSERIEFFFGEME